MFLTCDSIWEFNLNDVGKSLEARMKEQIASSGTLERLTPFGVIVNSLQADDDLRTVHIPAVKELIDEHRVVVLRGYAPLVGTALPEFCERFGKLLDWDFGTVNDLRVRANAQNYLYTDRAVPFHWDGAFVGRVPHYIFFHCEAAPPPGSGGETLFCDTVQLLNLAPAGLREVWEKTIITYTTEKIVHYGGTFTSPVVCQHQVSCEKVLRYAEPVSDLNPVLLEIVGISQEAKKDLIDDLHQKLNDERVCYQHQWLKNDFVIADNYVLLHGRHAFDGNAERHIRRVNIL